MPKRITETELQPVYDVIERQPEGIGIAAIERELERPASRRTLVRRLAALEAAGRITRKGAGPSTLYLSVPTPAPRRAPLPPVSETFETPEGPVTLPLTSAARGLLEYVSQPIAARWPKGYERTFLDQYRPNQTAYLPDATKAHLHRVGRPIEAERPAGTFARDILSRLLIDLSWASSRLEGNTYSRLDTQRLIEFGVAAEGKDAKETQMILNHKRAIELVVEGGADIAINPFTLLNLHALLSENLMADPEASGRLRRRPVDIGGSAYTPPGVPQVIEDMFQHIIDKAAAIEDPLEKAFFLMVQVPYLQPFEDVNKRVSRLAANIPLIKANLCPLSFVDVPERAYIAGTLAVYEGPRIELLRDIFVWAYERSAQRYVVIRDSVAEPDVFQMKYRDALAEVIRKIVHERKAPSEELIRRRSELLVEARDRDRFVDLVVREFHRLYEGNIARYRIPLSEYRAWHAREQ
jgi:Fic family protein